MSNTKLTDKQKVTTMAVSDYVFGNFGGKVGQMSIQDFRSHLYDDSPDDESPELSALKSRISLVEGKNTEHDELIAANTTKISSVESTANSAKSAAETAQTAATTARETATAASNAAQEAKTAAETAQATATAASTEAAAAKQAAENEATARIEADAALKTEIENNTTEISKLSLEVGELENMIITTLNTAI